MLGGYAMFREMSNLKTIALLSFSNDGCIYVVDYLNNTMTKYKDIYIERERKREVNVASTHVVSVT